MELDRAACYRALTLRDARFDGRFFTAVRTTRIYCRPICPARTPLEANCLFLPSAAAAQAAGYRPCLRCRPEVAPGTAGWRGTQAAVSRALSLIAEGALDAGTVADLAERLGLGERQLRRLFAEHVGASPQQISQARRVLFAKELLHETSLPMAQVALASGFRSLRRFNEVLRRELGRASAKLRRSKVAEGAALTLRLPFVAPYDWDSMAAFLAGRAIAGVEVVDERGYRRTVALEGAVGTVEVKPAKDGAQLLATVRLSRIEALAPAVARLRRLFDVDADGLAIGKHLSRDPLLAPLVAARPGLRVPGAWEPFEIAVRAILGQQVSVAAARTLAGRLVAAHGESLPAPLEPALSKLFPTAQALAAADLTLIGLPGARARSLSALAAAVAADPAVLSSAARLAAAKLPGIGPWTAAYVAMRALREPDAFPASDLVLRKSLAAGSASARSSAPAALPSVAEVEFRSEAWRPYRAYAALHLWTSETRR